MRRRHQLENLVGLVLRLLEFHSPRSPRKQYGALMQNVAELFPWPQKRNFQRRLSVYNACLLAQQIWFELNCNLSDLVCPIGDSFEPMYVSLEFFMEQRAVADMHGFSYFQSYCWGNGEDEDDHMAFSQLCYAF
jgi:hypothetical protein